MNTFLRTYLQLIFFAIFLSLETLAVIDGPYFPIDYQVIDFDVTHQDLLKVIGPRLNTSYLQLTNQTFNKEKQGIIWGTGIRSFIGFPVRLNHRRCPQQISVIFKVDTGAAITTLTKEVIDILYKNCPSIEKRDYQPYTVHINDRQIQIQLSKGHYHHINILGSNFMRENNIKLQVDYSQDLKQKLRIIFDANVLNEEM